MFKLSVHQIFCEYDPELVNEISEFMSRNRSFMLSKTLNNLQYFVELS